VLVPDFNLSSANNNARNRSNPAKSNKDRSIKMKSPGRSLKNVSSNTSAYVSKGNNRSRSPR
jgi:hypothetical protein